MIVRRGLLALTAAVLLAGCTHSSPAVPAAGRTTGSAASAESANAAAASGATTSLTPSVGGSTGSTHPNAGGTSGTSTGASAAVRTAGLLPPGTNPSGVICDYVSQSDVAAILPGAPVGQETDLAPSAVSYCAFSTASAGTVNVGVKNMGTATAASSIVNQKYTSMSQESEQSTTKLSIGGELAFETGSSTPLQNGTTLYALNAQGSHGSWYVTIQYYAHHSVTQAAMEHLLATVLGNVS